ncbi:ABC transporter permease, partial [Pseudomonas putida]
SAFANHKGGISQAIEQLAQVGKQANATLAETQALMRNANSLLGTEGKQAIGSAEQAMQSLAASTATINSLLND